MNINVFAEIGHQLMVFSKIIDCLESLKLGGILLFVQAFFNLKINSNFIGLIEAIVTHFKQPEIN